MSLKGPGFDPLVGLNPHFRFDRSLIEIHQIDPIFSYRAKTRNSSAYHPGCFCVPGSHRKVSIGSSTGGGGAVKKTLENKEDEEPSPQIMYFIDITLYTSRPVGNDEVRSAF